MLPIPILLIVEPISGIGMFGILLYITHVNAINISVDILQHHDDTYSYIIKPTGFQLRKT